MKPRKLTLVAIYILIAVATVSAQKVETVKRIKFGTEDNFGFWTEYDDHEGGYPGMGLLFCDKECFIVWASKTQFEGDTFFKINKMNSDIETKITTEWKNPFVGNYVCGYIQDGYIYGYIEAGDERNELNFIINYKGRNWCIKEKSEIFFKSSIFSNDTFYAVDNNIFFETSLHELVSIELLDAGKYRLRNEEETKEYLTEDRKEELGIDYVLNRKGKVTRICIGSYSLKPLVDGINYWKICNEQYEMMNDKYNEYKNISSMYYSSTPYYLMGYDKKGLHYFQRFENNNGDFTEDNPGFNVKFCIAVLDTWTRRVYFYEDYKADEWNPPRDKKGNPLCGTSWTVAPDGNIYFTDCDLTNKEYLIKKVSNRWYKDIGIDQRHIGIFIKNHVPLYKNSSLDSETDGFNYENDIVWELESKEGWSRIRNLDGREGWVERKYIAFE